MSLDTRMPTQSKHGSTPCTFYARGRCKNGAQCRFLHDASISDMPLQDASEDKKQPCFEWEMVGSCARPNCWYRHAAQNRGMRAPKWNERINMAVKEDAERRSLQANMVLNLQAELVWRQAQYARQEIENVRLSVLADMEITRWEEELRRAAEFQLAVEAKFRDMDKLVPTPPPQVQPVPHVQSSIHLDNTSSPILPPTKSTAKRGEKPCVIWNKSGRCPKGTKCQYMHNPGDRGGRISREESSTTVQLDSEERERRAEQSRRDKQRIWQLHHAQDLSVVPPSTLYPASTDVDDVELRRRAEQSRLAKKCKQDRYAVVDAEATIDEAEARSRAEQSCRDKERLIRQRNTPLVPDQEHSPHVEAFDSGTPRSAGRARSDEKHAEIVLVAEHTTPACFLAAQHAHVKAAKDNRHLTQQRRRDQRSSDIAKAAEDYDRRKAAEQARLIVEEAQHIAAEESRIRDREAARLQAVEDARRRDEEEARRKAEEEERRRVVEEEREQARRMREQAQEAQFQTRSLEEATVTLKHVALGSIMTFGAGLEVHSVIPAFACRMIRIKNLPANARDHEIRDLFTQQGIEAERFHVISCKPTRDGKQQATAVVPAELTTVLTAAIDGVEFRDDKLEFEVCGNHLSGGMNTSSSRNASSLTVSWRSPSVRFVAEYDDIPRAQARAEALNKTIHGGRRLSVDMNTLPPGRVVSGYNAASISIQGLPRTVTEDEVRTLAETACIRRLLYKNGIESQSVPEDAFNQILREVEQISPGTVNRHESVVQDRERELDGIVAYTIHFSSSDAACLVYDRLHQRVFPGVSPKALWLTPPQPFSFGITIPCGQYDAQKKLWDQLAHVLSEKECKLVAKQAKDVVSLRLYGRAQRSIGIAKVRVEVLASGQAIPGWNRSLCSPNNGFFVQVSRSTGAHVRIDWRKQTICAYGESGPIESAREMVAAELKRLETQEHTVRLKDTSVGFFVRRGIDALKELVGPEAVDFQPSTRRITITGGEMALHHLTRLVKESADQGHTHAATDSDCPICFCPVSSPCRIGCDHVYCEGCLVDWFTNAIENKEFPLLCIANEARCERPISIPTIKRLLPQAKMRELLETAAKSYIRTHAADFKYCKTPDCAQIYRVSDSASASTLQCPACFAEVCTGCGQDGHEDTTCEEQQRMLRWSLDDEWMKGQGLKKCPTCGQGIQKNDGCNHITCRCGAHFCWLCLFNGNDIYGHLNQVHNGPYDNPNAIAAVPDIDMEEQREVLRQAALLRELAG